MGFDMPARQAFTVEMTSREDLLNAISLNSSIVNGARVVGPSVAGLMIGAVGVAMCFFLNGLSFIAVIAGFSHDAAAAVPSAHAHASPRVSTRGTGSSIRSNIDVCARFYCFFSRSASSAGRMRC